METAKTKRPKKPPAPKIKFTVPGLRALKPTDPLRYDTLVPKLAFDPSVKASRPYKIAMRIVGKLVKKSWSFATPLETVRKEARDFESDAVAGIDKRVDEKKAKAKVIAETADTVHAVIKEHLDAKEVKAISPRAHLQRKTLLEQFRDAPSPGGGTYGARTMASLKRRELVKFLNKVETEAAARCVARAQERAAKRAAQKGSVPVAIAPPGDGARTAESMRRELNTFFNWFAANDDDFKNPLTRKTRPGRPAAARKRERNLVDLSAVEGEPTVDGDASRVDDEWIAMWRAAEQLPGPAGVMPRFVLATGGRRGEIARMRRYELSTYRLKDGTERTDWRLPEFDSRNPKERRSKIKKLPRPLSQLAVDLLAELDEFEGSEFVFTVDGEKAFTNFYQAKQKLDELMLDELRKMAVARGEDPDAVVLKPWEQFRDLRRTSRTLMSRIKTVDHEIRERALGHATGTAISRIYDGWEYPAELRTLYDGLATLIMDRLDPPSPDKVIGRIGKAKAAA
jgi:integrase